MIAFLHIPKTGGTLMRQYIKEHLTDRCTAYGHRRWDEVKDKGDDPFWIAFVRNPFDWYVSRYFYFAKHHERVEGGISIECDSGLWGSDFVDKFPTVKDHVLWGLEFVHNFSFESRFDEMCRNKNGEIVMHHIGKLETYEHDWDVVLRMWGIEPEVTIGEFYEKHKETQYINKSGHEHFSKYYDDELREKVVAADKFIFDYFGYFRSIK